MVNARIVIGDPEAPDFVFENEKLDSVICENAVSITGGEMTADVLEVTYFCKPNSGIKDLPYGKAVFYYSGGEYVGEYYLTNNEQVAKEKFLLRATSIIGIIEKEAFYGGMYTTQPFSDVVNDILFTDGLATNRMGLYDAQSKTHPTYGSMMISDDISPAYHCKYYLDFTLVDIDWSAAYDQTSAWEIIAGQYGYQDRDNSYYIRLDVTRSSVSSPPSWSVSLFYFAETEASLYTRKYPIMSDMGNGSRVKITVDPRLKKVDYTVARVVPGSWTTKWETGTVPVEYDSNPSRTTNMKLGCAFGAAIEDGTPYNIRAAVIRWHEFKLYNNNDKLLIDAVLAYDDHTDKKYVLNLVDKKMIETSYYDEVGTKKGDYSEQELNERQLAIKNAITYAEGVAALPVSGWIKNGTKRTALHELLFSQNVSLIKSQSGGYIFTALSDSVTGEISDDDLYTDGKEEKLKQAKKISLTEYAFSSEGATSQIIYDNSASDAQDGKYIAVFKDAPISGAPVAGAGITIHSYNCNVALVSGRGQITGVPFIQSKTVVTYNNENEADGTDVTVADVGLITTANSDSIASRLKAYYFAEIHKITCGLVYRGEKCGATYSMTSPFDEKISAFLTRYSARASSFLKADCEFYAGFKPRESGGYTGYQILTNGMEFVIPQSVKDKAEPIVRLNIIGKGSAGAAGADGENGKEPEQTSGYKESGGDGGKGGKGGTGGDGGRVYVVTVNVASVYNVSVEQSGVNVLVRTKDSSGSTLNTYSSASGNSIAKGITNVFTGITYAVKGPNGIDGGDGGKGGGVSGAYTYVAGESGGDVREYKGGSSFSGGHATQEYYITSFCAYGGGGGASARANGGNAQDAGNGFDTVGGNGADGGAAVVTMTNYGCGGSGGNGGGGGGGAASIAIHDSYDGSVMSSNSNAGNGGAGGAGSDGIDGCALIYY